MNSALRPIEVYDAAALVQDLLARKPIRISVPESLTGFVRMVNVDWSGEVEIPPRNGLSDTVTLDGLLQGMVELHGRFLGLQALVYREHGRIFFTMLGGTRYAARVDWSSSSSVVQPTLKCAPSSTPLSRTCVFPPGANVVTLPRGRGRHNRG